MATQEELTETELRSRDGSSVAIREDVLETRDSRGRLVFQYDPRTGRGVVHFPGGVEISSSKSLRLSSAEMVEIAAGRGIVIDSRCVRARVGEADFEGGRVAARAGEAKFVWGKLDQSVGRLVQTVRNLYQRIEALWHVRAGRVRTESQGSYLLQAEDARVQAKGDVRIQGESINLG